MHMEPVMDETASDNGVIHHIHVRNFEVPTTGNCAACTYRRLHEAVTGFVKRIADLISPKSTVLLSNFTVGCSSRSKSDTS
jgi:hypothetical protein